MYIPASTAIDDEHARSIVAEAGSGWFVTAGGDGIPEATLLPIIWHANRVVAHMAAANPHWRNIDEGQQALLIVTGPEAYVSPSWYPSKADHGRAVPTWNYEAVHISGRVSLHHDPEWLRTAVTDLTDVHEVERPDRWRVTDAPEAFVSRQLTAIVGIELKVDRIEGKSKLSQNRSSSDRDGVISGLQSTPDRYDNRRVADAMIEIRTKSS